MWVERCKNSILLFSLILPLSYQPVGLWAEDCGLASAASRGEGTGKVGVKVESEDKKKKIIIKRERERNKRLVGKEEDQGRIILSLPLSPHNSIAHALIPPSATTIVPAPPQARRQPYLIVNEKMERRREREKKRDGKKNANVGSCAVSFSFFFSPSPPSLSLSFFLFFSSLGLEKKKGEQSNFQLHNK